MLSIENRIECAMVEGIQSLLKNAFITNCWITTCWNFDKLYGIIYRERKNETSNPTLWFFNCHICFNAETETEHTECDRSYTTITAPEQVRTDSKDGKFNKGVFQFVINTNEIVTLPMNIGVSFCHSGFLFTHRQQIDRKSKEYPEFVNIVTYNSRSFFEHVMESFRRSMV